MLALLRLAVFGFVVMTIAYIGLSLYSRGQRRNKLAAEWMENSAVRNVSQDEFVQEGLRRYDGSLRRKLILGVYVVPTSLVALIVYLTNFH